MTHYGNTNYITFGCTEFTCKHRKSCLASTELEFGRNSQRAPDKLLNFLKPHLYLTFVERRWGKTTYKVGCREYEAHSKKGEC